MRLITFITLALTLGCSGKTENAVTSPGEDGAAGEGGEEGAPGEDGEDGLPCWDTNGNGEPDPEEDTNGDGVVDVEDCRGDGSADTDRIYFGDLDISFEFEAEYFCERYDRVYGTLSVTYEAEDLSAMSCLREVTHSLGIHFPDMPTCVLPNLESVGWMLSLGVDACEELRFDSLETVGDLMNFGNIGRDSPAGADVSFPVLTSVSAMTFFTGATNEMDFPELTTVELYLSVDGQDGLTNLDGFSALESVGENWLRILNNPDLVDITGLMGVTHVGGLLEITGNTSLPTSQAEDLEASIDYIGGDVIISGNGPG
jgi:hypothetical protein